MRGGLTPAVDGGTVLRMNRARCLGLLPLTLLAARIGDRADNASPVHSPHLTTPPSRGRSVHV